MEFAPGTSSPRKNIERTAGFPRLLSGPSIDQGCGTGAGAPGPTDGKPRKSPRYVLLDLLLVVDKNVAVEAPVRFDPGEGPSLGLAILGHD